MNFCSKIITIFDVTWLFIGKCVNFKFEQPPEVGQRDIIIFAKNTNTFCDKQWKIHKNFWTKSSFHKTHTRCDQKITVILNFVKKYLFINNYLVPFKVTRRRYNTFMPVFFQSSKLCWKSLLGIANSSCFDFPFIFSIVEKRFPFIGVFSFWKRKMSAGAKSGINGGWGSLRFCFFAKNSRTSIDVWADALSWFKIHDWVFHNSMRF